MNILLTTISICLHLSNGYKGVLLFPGLGLSMQYIPMQTEILKHHPGTDVVMATHTMGLVSHLPMWTQIHIIYKSKAVSQFLARNPGGFHIVSGSQGTLVSRGMIEYYGLPVINFISISGLHMGQYGAPENYIPANLSTHLKEEFYRILYTRAAQKLFSIAGYWRDPCHYDLYKKFCEFLPVVNNEINHTRAAEFKHNFIKIEKLYLFDSPDDGIVNPWMSGHFGSIACNGTILEMQDQDVYKEDSFGLKTLDLRGAIHHEVIPKLTHFQSAINMTFVRTKIVPLLT